MVKLRRIQSLGIAVVVNFCLFVPHIARANGRFPIADQLVIDPADPSHFVLRTTYGILGSTDAGANFSWMCEVAVGYGGTQDPAIGILADSTILAGVFEGLAVSHDRRCSWSFVGNPLNDEYVIDVSVHHGDPSRAVAITSTGTDTGFHVILAETSDNGVTWTQAGTPILSDMIALTVDVAPSNSDRVYVSGIVGKSYAPAIERSDDRGKTWKRTYFEATYAKDVPFISAIDPVNPDRVYLRMSGDPLDRLLVSDDGATTWTEAYAGMADLLGFALSPDGSRVAVGGPSDGIQVANTTDFAFQQTSMLVTRCLTWSATGLYACANQFVDNFTLGLSKDEGITFTPLYNLTDICPLECADAAPGPAACKMYWPSIVATLGIDPNACGGVVAGSSSSSSGGTPPTPLPSESNCGCNLEPQSQEWAPLAFVALALTCWRRRRRVDNSQ